MQSLIVSAEWLQAQLQQLDLVILDASSQSNKAGLETQFKHSRIKNARYFDFKKEFSDTTSPYPNMLTSPEQFEQKCRALGIQKSNQIVVYDNLGIHTSPRVWWMFKSMGHEAVAVLDGGLPYWIKQGYAVEAIQKESYGLGDFEANFQDNLVRDIHFMQSNLTTKKALVLDARSAERFQGIAPEPRKGLRSGYIPHSINLPYTAVLKDGKYKSKAALAALFHELELEDRPLVFSCGSGVTACIILLASALVCSNEKSVYDGSWTEWAQVN